MNDGVMEFLRSKILPEEVHGLDVLEVGSMDVNGSPRKVILPHGPAKYTGVDFTYGPGVDIILDVKHLTTYFSEERFDVVVSTEMLEHASDWKVAVNQMKRVLRPRGLLVITTRSPGFPFHGYPYDYWRFTIDDFKAIFSDMDIVALQSDSPKDPGVFMKAFKRYSHPETDLDKIIVGGVS